VATYIRHLKSTVLAYIRTSQAATVRTRRFRIRYLSLVAAVVILPGVLCRALGSIRKIIEVQAMKTDYPLVCGNLIGKISIALLTLLCSARVVYAETPVLQFTEVKPGVYVHFGRQQAMSIDNRGDIANIGFIVGESSIAVIDPGGSPEIGELMRSEIAAVSSLPVSHVIITHSHPDHMFGGSAFADVPHILAHRNFTRALAQRALFYRNAFKELFTSANQMTALTPTEDTFESLQVDLGGRTLTLQQHPVGHTDNDLTVWDDQTRTLWASDVLFVGRVPSLDGSLTGWLSTMDALSELPVDIVIPGHGAAGSWEELAKPQRRYLQKLLDQTRSAIAGNERLSEAIETVASDESDQWILFDVRHPGNVTRAFTELEWE